MASLHVFFAHLGECVIALKAMFSVKPEPFESVLTHKGEATGKIK